MRVIAWYLLPVVSVAAAIVLRSVLFPGLLYAPYIAFFPCITLSALYGGLGPGFFAIVLSVLVVSNFFVSGLSALSDIPGGLEGMLVFIGSGTVIMIVCSQLNGAKQRISTEARRLHQSEMSLAAELVGHRRAEEELKRLSYKNKLILESAGEGICEIDTQGLVTFTNKAAADMLGYTIDELIGQHSHSQWHHTRPDGTPYPSDKCPIYASYREWARLFRGGGVPAKGRCQHHCGFYCKPIFVGTI